MGVEAQAARLVVGARRGEKADPEMQVAADPQPAPPERLHAAAHVASDSPPGRVVGGDQGVGLALRRLEPRSIVLEHHVPFAVRPGRA